MAPVQRALPHWQLRLPNGAIISRAMWREEMDARFPQPTFARDEPDDTRDLDQQDAALRDLEARLTNHVTNGHPLARAARDAAAGRLSPARPLERPQVKPQGFVPRDTGVQRE
jgi:hypothetical protein